MRSLYEIRSFPLPSVSSSRYSGVQSDDEGDEGDEGERHAFSSFETNPDCQRHCRFCWAQLDEGCDDYVAPCDCKGSMVRASFRDGGFGTCRTLPFSEIRAAWDWPVVPTRAVWTFRRVARSARRTSPRDSLVHTLKVVPAYAPIISVVLTQECGGTTYNAGVCPRRLSRPLGVHKIIGWSGSSKTAGPMRCVQEALVGI